MAYEELLNQFSNDLIKGEPHLKVYYRNRLLGVVERLKETYPSVMTQVGFANFRFLCKAYLEEKGMKSPNIHDFLFGFPEFLNKAEDMHEEETLYYLAQLDWLWFTATKPGIFIEIPKGIYFLWQSLVNETQFRGTVDFDQLERIQIIESEGDLNLMLLKV